MTTEDEISVEVTEKVYFPGVLMVTEKSGTGEEDVSVADNPVPLPEIVPETAGTAVQRL